MRIDADHIRKLQRAIEPNGNLRICPRRMRHLTDVLSPWEHGLAMRIILRAAERVAASRKITHAQRVLLALVLHDAAKEEKLETEARREVV